MVSNAWINYYRTRENYYGKHGSNADKIISLLNLQKSDFVLDIGCGPGAFLDDIKQKVGSTCAGIDISFDAIKKRHTKGNILIVSDMRWLPFKSRTFTKVFSLGTIEHAPETKAIIGEISRVLKTNGHCYLTAPNKISFFHITKNIKILFGLWDLGYEKSFTPKQLINELKSAGLLVTDYFIIPHPKTSNLFNVADNILNKISNKLFGFFLCVLAEK